MLIPGINKKTPEAIQYLRSLYSSATSSELKQYLIQLEKPKEQTLEILIAGIEEFTRIANLNASKRNTFFGNKFGGLHYNNDLAKLWNNHSVAKTKAYELNGLSPLEWDYVLDESDQYLVYRGEQPAEALDKLLQGPTVIDCGMFCELSIWFGIRYMLGNEKFNQVFGNTPLYITQYVYKEIKNPLKPYLGNPLYPFFIKSQSQSSNRSIGIVHIPNHSKYQLKHAGGNYGGENCILIDAKNHIIFDPSLPKTSLQEFEVEELLRNAYNAPQNENDANKLALYAETPEQLHPSLLRTYQELLTTSKKLENEKIDEDAWKNSDKGKRKNIFFDFENFKRWLDKLDKVVTKVNYAPLPDNQLRLAKSLLEQIPFENRHTMSFSAFKLDTHEQQEMHSLSLQFCQHVMKGQSIHLTLTGKAGIGKTAAAVCAAKELISRGKKIVWLSEVTVHSWMDKAVNIAELETCREHIKTLLQDNPDAVFLDDDNLIGYSGQVLLEEVYSWYVHNATKGLFITSNEVVTFKTCYGLKVDKKYYPTPFPGYTSYAYQNTIVRRGLTGKSLRAKPVLNSELTDDNKIKLLCTCRPQQSVGIIITKEAFEASKFKLGALELIPAVDNDKLTSIRESLMNTETTGPVYEKLSDLQKNWLRQYEVPGIYLRSIHRPAHIGINVKPFEKTDYKIIAIEFIPYKNSDGEITINDESMQQLIRVINYVHDMGGKKVIIINDTGFSIEELIKQIKQQIPEREKKRTIARFENLFFSPSLLSTAYPANNNDNVYAAFYKPQKAVTVTRECIKNVNDKTLIVGH